MGIKSFLGKWYASREAARIDRWKRNAPATQARILSELLSAATETAFGREHGFGDIRDYEAFKKAVPVRDYEGLRPWIEQVVHGDENILWPGKPLYLAKTSGTTSGVKYIPISKESMPGHIKGARNALLSYIHETGKADFVDGKLIFLQGSPVLERKAGIQVGRLSGIVAHHVPGYLQKNRMPSYATNCIEDWELKVDAIVTETLREDMRLISGIPPWVQMYFDRLSERSGGAKVGNIFPNFSLFVYGGVNFEPYRAKLEESIGRRVDSIETYPASEGFIAYQDSQTEPGLLLLTDAGIFYEFIPAGEYHKENPRRLSLSDVKLGENYAIILNTNAGLWGYSIGDTVKFVSIDPYKIVVTGRVKHFISAFGEHVIGEEVEKALLYAAAKAGAGITEFTVAPQVNPPEGGNPYHEWFIEFSTPPADPEAFALEIDGELRRLNTYYNDLVSGNILRTLVIRSLKAGAFVDYMKRAGKLGGQNKVPRLSDNRDIAEGLAIFVN